MHNELKMNPLGVPNVITTQQRRFISNEIRGNISLKIAIKLAAAIDI